MKINVRVAGLETFPGQPQVKQAITRSLSRSARGIVVRAERNLSGRYVRMRTGKLRRGMRSRVTVRDNTFVATVRNIVFYGHILEGGARAHRITPKAGKWLRFEVAGKTVFARGVTNPGIRPRRWFDSAVREAVPEMQRAFEQELGDMTRGTSLFRGAV